ncbi:META domain-containing protein [Aureliella helgolandensis]|uniref:META domain protein n=1 Tax=Aureliella helgolandensis TaxID=2527968 RepID=A0A518GFG8_9BACT|nr:META domain-containing protein [Aureliella helgolandensis]QDV27339.1 META domain protein [Aureliella helgolandensis]
MRIRRLLLPYINIFGFVAMVSLFGMARFAVAADPLGSWNEGAAKQSILEFVERVTREGSPAFVPSAERVAVFDNDGTLWPEAPLPFQAAFVFDELRRRAPLEPELADDPFVQAALQGDLSKLLAGKNHDGLMHVIGVTHAGMTTDEFDQRVNDWLATAKHPRFEKPYSELTYQPMQELLVYLRLKGFKTFIVSGGGADFMRVWSERVYGIPPENVVGSMWQARFELRDGLPVLVKTMDHLFVDDKEGKPVGIHQFIGRRPIACFGNSDGDQAMLEYTTIGNPRASFGLIVHHTDAEREYAYDANPQSSGKLTTALTRADECGWTVVDMKVDWQKIWSDPAGAPSEGVALSLVGKWLAEDIDSAGVIDLAQSTLEFSADGAVSGSSAVNRFQGQAKVDHNSCTFGPLAMTRRAGPPALMDQESKFMAALQRVVQYRIAETGLLFLIDAEGTDVLRFSKMEN